MESRLTDLESRVAFQDDLLEALNRIVAEQQGRIDTLQQQVRLLYEQLSALAPDVAGPGADEPPPPHY